ncbi:MAG TPA: cytochrome P450 [Rhizomicrobium sp.]|jgi:hypothetical protein
MTVPASDPLSGLRPNARTAVYRALLRESPVHWSRAHAAWVLMRYGDVSLVLRHPQALALKVAPFLEKLSRRGNADLTSLLAFTSSLSLMMRPPRHDVVRRLFAQVMGNFRRSKLPGLLEARADTLLLAGTKDGSIDLARGYGRELALFTIGTILGIPAQDLSNLGDIGGGLIAIFDRMLPSMSRMAELNRAAAMLIEYFERLIADRRRMPQDDGLSAMLSLATGELACSDQELAGFCSFFFIAAEETTAAALAAAAFALLDDGDLRARLTRDHTKIAGFAREILRLSSPVQYVAREAGIDLDIGGQAIRAGQGIVLMLGAANRDPDVFPEPDTLDVDRAGPEPLAFAAGPYRCIGAQLATFEIELATTRLLEWPNLFLSPEAPVWEERMNIAGLRRLTACFSREGLRDARD